MGFKIKRLVSQAIPAVTSAVGAYFGGPAGAAAGYTGGENVAGIVGLGQDQLNAEEELKRNKKLADYQFGKNVEMWNLQNAYNDPSQQMARLQAAGLNPNLVYGGGNVTGNTTSGYPTYNSPEYKYSDTSVARKQLALAMEEHQQRITNQAIENDLARQRLVLAERNADREDALARAQIANMQSLLAMRNDPLTPVINSVTNTIDSYKNPIADAAERFVDWIYPTAKPSVGRGVLKTKGSIKK